MKVPTILVAGGTGYIGSHVAKTLLDAGFRVVTVDNLSSSYRDAVSGGNFVQGDIRGSRYQNPVVAAFIRV